MSSTAVNGRFMTHRVTGMQRYAHEVIARMSIDLDILRPLRGQGIPGHLWEQTLLPRKARGRVLWSPCTAGPMRYRRHVITIHDLFPVEHPEWYSPRFSNWYRLMITELARSARKIITVSDYTKERLCTRFKVDSAIVHTVHSGVSESFRPQHEGQVRRTLAKLGIPSRRYILSVSSLEARKNLTRVLAAWREALPNIPQDCWLVLAGSEAAARVFGRQDQAQIPPRVFFPGYVDDVDLPSLYTGAQVFLLASMAEGFGLPVIEAMACGAPCLVSNTSSLPEIAGEAASYVDPLNTEDISRGIQMSAAKPIRTEPSANCLIKARSYSWLKAALKTQDIIGTVHERAPAASS